MFQAERAILRAAFDEAVAAAHPGRRLPSLLPPPPRGRIILLAAGKGAGAMVETAERAYLDDFKLPEDRLIGLGVARHGYGRPTRLLKVIEAGHPLPDAAGLAAAAEVLSLAESAGPDDLVLVLLSGGGSANWVLPVEGVSLEEKRGLTRALQKSGADIVALNVVRKHLSRIKGGRLARAAAPAEIVTLAISDVPGDDPSALASGPTSPDPSTLADAQKILKTLGQDFPAASAALADPRNETPKPGDPIFDRTRFALIARPQDALDAAAKALAARGYEPIRIGDALDGEARDVARLHASQALAFKSAGRRVALISGGELTVTVRGEGRGGPNQEYCLSLALALDGAANICALAADTDGSDGGFGDADDPAGAFIFPDTLVRGGDARAALAANDSTRFFATIGDLLQTGPTYTNVNDLRVILVGDSDGRL